MKQLMILTISLILIQGIVRADAKPADSPSNFKCEEKATVEQNNIYLDQLSAEIQREAILPQLKSDVALMVQLIQKVLCSFQIDQDLAVFEYVSGYEGTKSFVQARAKLSPVEQETLDESLKILAREETE